MSAWMWLGAGKLVFAKSKDDAFSVYYGEYKRDMENGEVLRVGTSPYTAAIQELFCVYFSFAHWKNKY
jgi:hypothetical protein